jgi:hypothetical protein
MGTHPPVRIHLERRQGQDCGLDCSLGRTLQRAIHEPRVRNELVDVLVTLRDEHGKARRCPRRGHRGERFCRRRQPSRNWRKPVEIGVSGRLAEQRPECKGGRRCHYEYMPKGPYRRETGMSARRFSIVTHDTRRRVLRPARRAP